MRSRWRGCTTSIQLVDLKTKLGIKLNDQTGSAESNTECERTPADAPRDRTRITTDRKNERPKKQRLSTREVLAAFKGMGGTAEEQEADRVRLKVDASYFQSWTDPSWLHSECALGDCALAVCMQYVAHYTHVCAWCEQHALPDYM